MVVDINYEVLFFHNPLPNWYSYLHGQDSENLCRGKDHSLFTLFTDNDGDELSHSRPRVFVVDPDRGGKKDTRPYSSRWTVSREKAG